MTGAFFYDTWAFVALANAGDIGHSAAVELDLKLEHSGYVAVTTDYVLDETVTLLNRDAGPMVAIAFLDGLLARAESTEHQLIDVDATCRARACTLFKRLAPEARQLSFTDVTSFAVMHELGLTHAFTADQHFHRAGKGIRPLLEQRGRAFRSTSEI